MRCYVALNCMLNWRKTQGDCFEMYNVRFVVVDVIEIVSDTCNAPDASTIEVRVRMIRTSYTCNRAIVALQLHDKMQSTVLYLHLNDINRFVYRR